VITIGGTLGVGFTLEDDPPPHPPSSVTVPVIPTNPTRNSGFSAFAPC
jgi:hypothetical protein